MKSIIRSRPLFLVMFILLNAALIAGLTLLAAQYVNAEELPPDTEAPSAPANLALMDKTSSTIVISWDMSTDNVGVVGYDVYKDEVLIDTVTSNSYLFSDLQPQTEYTFYVMAKDEAGNISDPSNIITVTTDTLPDMQPPSAPTNLVASEITSTSIHLTWDASTDNNGVVGYDIYSEDMLLGTVSDLSYTVAGLSPATEYLFTVKSKDAANNISEPGTQISATTLLPSPAFAEPVISDTSVVLTWNTIQGGEGYDLEIDGIVTDNGSSTEYNHNGLIQMTSHTYRVRAKSSVNSGEWSEPLTVMTFSSVNVSGTISSDTTWTYGTVYNIQSNLTVAQGARLNIEPGVIIKSKPSVRLIINGELNSVGTAGRNIIFTSFKDSQYGGTGVSASSDYWSAIVVSGAGKVNASYIKVKYAASAGSSIAISTTSDFILTNSEISGNRGRGISLDSFGTGNLIIRDNIICNNTGYAIYVNLNNLGSSIFGGIMGNTYSNNIYKGLPYNSVQVEGTLKTNLIFDSCAGHYTSKNITIPLGYSLTLQKGVILKSDNYSNKITVNGTLITSGIADNPVVLTTINDPTYGGGGLSGLYDRWNGILINATGELNGDYTYIRYAGYFSGEKAIELKGKITLTNSEMIYSASYDIYVNGSCNALLRNCRFKNTSYNCFNFDSTASGIFTIEDSLIYNCGYNAFNISGNTDITISNTHINVCGGTGVYINTSGAGKISITGNTIEGCDYNSIYVLKFGIGKFTAKNNNFINNNGVFYIALEGLNSSIFNGIADNSFTNNIYLGKLYDSIYLKGSPTIDLLFSKNKYAIGQNKLTIPQNKTLYIEAGTELRFNNQGSELVVNGSVIAQGTHERPIIMTSYNDPKYPSKIVFEDFWGGIDIGDTGEFTGDYVKIRNARAPADSNINVLGKLTLTNSEITNSYNIGINFNTLIQPVLSFNTFKNNNYAVNNARPSEIIIDATNNYWNSINGPGINKNRVSTGVEYDPWLGMEFKYQFHNGFGGVYAPTGNYSRTFTDLNLSSPGFDIAISRTYNSNDTRLNGPMGAGWTFSFESSIKDYGAGVPLKVVRLPNGSTLSFTCNDDGSYAADNSRNILEKQVNGLFVLTTKDQYKYYFNANGYLTDIVDRNGNTVTITVDDDGKVLGVSDQVQRHFTINYENGLIKSISDPAGRTVFYDYFEGRLVKATDPAGFETHYSYDAEGSLCEIKDNSMHVIEAITYDRTTGENRNKVLSKTDTFGNIFSYSYDNINRKVTMTDLNNRETVQWYDDSMFITNTRDPEGKLTTIEYFLDANGQNNLGEIKSNTDRYGKKTQYERDVRGNVTKVTNPDNSTKVMTYDIKNNLTSIKDELGKYTWMIYDQNGINLVKKAQPLNGTSVYNGVDDGFAVVSYAYYSEQESQQLGYLAKGLLKSVTDPEGNTTTYAYDVYGNSRVITDAEGNQFVNEFDILGRKTKVISAEGYQTAFYYDDNGNVEKLVMDNGETIRTTYDFRGNKTKEVSPNQYDPSFDNSTNHTYNGDHGFRYTYYANGMLNTLTDPENNTTTYTYDLYGNLLTEIKPNGAEYSYEYDTMNRVVRSYFTDINSTPLLLEEYAYVVLPGGNTQKVVTKHLNDSEVAVTYLTYDYAGRQLEQKNPDNTTLKTEYHANGLIKTTTDAKGNISYFYYDGLNRLIEEKIPFEKIGSTTYYTIRKKEYNKNGSIILEKNTNNKPGETETYNQTGYEYNGRNLLVKVITYDNGSPVNYTQYFYDADGNKIRMYTGLSLPLLINGLDSVTPQGDVNYSTTKYSYNHLGKLAAMTDPLNNTITYGYDLNGNITTILDRNGNTTTFTYDNMNRLLNKKVNCFDSTCNAEYTYTYDSLGGILTMSGGGTDYTYTYDGMGRLIGEIQSNGFVKEYGYDTAGRRTSLRLYQNGALKQDLGYTYYVTSRLWQVIDNGTVAATYQFDLNGNRTLLTYANGNSTTYTYNLANKLKVLTNINGSSTISQYTYNYYLDGNQQSKTDSSGITSFVYDGLGRLVNVNEPGSIITAYQYDDYNNRTFMSVTGGLESYTTTYTYDLNNRLLSETKTTLNGTVTTNYSYDNNGNQITKGTGTYKYDGFNQLIQANDGFVCSYTYNGEGLRTGKTVGSDSVVHVWDGDQVIYEVDDSGALISSYIRGINLIKSFDASGAEIHYMFNGHGDVVQLTGSNGSVVKSYNYDAFGNEKSIDPNDANAFRYCGEYFDKETGTIYLRARYYDPEIGRFITEDSYWGKDSDPLSLNLYTYCQNDPIQYIDPSGYYFETAADIAFIIWDVRDIIADPGNGLNWAALGADVACTAIPFASGGGRAVKVALKAADGTNKLTNVEKAMIAVSKGEKLSTKMKEALRAEARTLMKNNSKSFSRAINEGKKLDVHHIIPLEYTHLFGKDFDPNNLMNLYGVDPDTHKLLNREWSDFKARFKKYGIEPSKQDIIDFAAKTLKDYGDKFIQ